MIGSVRTVGCSLLHQQLQALMLLCSFHLGLCCQMCVMFEEQLTFFWDLCQQVNLWCNRSLCGYVNSPVDEDDTAVKAELDLDENVWGQLCPKYLFIYPGSSGCLRLITSDLQPPGRDTTEGNFSCRNRWSGFERAHFCEVQTNVHCTLSICKL